LISSPNLAFCGYALIPPPGDRRAGRPVAPIGLCLNFIGVNPIRFLVFAAAFNGVAAVPLVWIINRIAAGRATMGAARSGWLSQAVLLLTFTGMAAAVVATVISYLGR
jgi:Mn2+/Fe2+ NRAMP family transporter